MKYKFFSLGCLALTFAILFFLLGILSLFIPWFQSMPKISLWFFGLGIVFLLLPYLKELNVFGISLKFQERLESLENLSLNNEVVSNINGELYYIFKNEKYRIENNDKFTYEMLISHKGIVKDPKFQSVIERIPLVKTIRLTADNILSVNNGGMYIIISLDLETAFYISSWTVLNQHGINFENVKNKIPLEEFQKRKYQIGR